jgi:hypothetical protein
MRTYINAISETVMLFSAFSMGMEVVFFLFIGHEVSKYVE